MKFSLTLYKNLVQKWCCSNVFKWFNCDLHYWSVLKIYCMADKPGPGPSGQASPGLQCCSSLSLFSNQLRNSFIQLEVVLQCSTGACCLPALWLVQITDHGIYHKVYAMVYAMVYNLVCHCDHGIYHRVYAMVTIWYIPWYIMMMMMMSWYIAWCHRSKAWVWGPGSLGRRQVWVGVR